MRKSLLLSLAALAFLASCASDPQARTQNLDAWEFSKDSTSWQSVTVPHSYNGIDGHSKSYYRGKGYYTTTVTLSKADLAGSVQLFFEGAAQAATVYVGQAKAAYHKGGYTPFTVDITSLAHQGENLITVVCDNTEDLTLAPVQSDFNKNGGLHNPVSLQVYGKAHLASEGFGHKRMHVATPEVSKQKAEIEISADLTGKSGDYDILTSIKDAQGNIILEDEASQGIGTFKRSLTLDAPHLWNGVKDPYLYTASIEVRKNGETIDRTETRFGIRTFYMDQEKGFFLNGEHYELRGTSIHQDLDQKATALTKEDYDRDYGFVKELGCNFVRLAHYPHNNYAFDLCDEMGLVVQTEIPWVNIIGERAEQPYFDNLHDQMREMVTSLYNHPSIIFWGMWNELDNWSNNDKYQGAFNAAKVVEMTAALYDQAKSLDPYRLVGLTDDSKLARDGYKGLKSDYISENRYNGWYYGTFAGFYPEITKLHEEGFTLNISEYGAGVNPYCQTWKKEDLIHDDDAKHFEQYGNEFHESHLTDICKMPFLNFTSIWVLFDFAVASRTEGYLNSSDGVNFTENEDRKYTNDKGLITRDRSLRKDVFYLYKSKWNQQEETVYITGRRLEYAPKGLSYQVKVYSNARKLSLYQGDRLIQTLEASGELTGVIWKFKPVTIAEGENVLRVVSDSGKEDTVTLKSL